MPAAGAEGEAGRVESLEKADPRLLLGSCTVLPATGTLGNFRQQAREELERDSSCSEEHLRPFPQPARKQKTLAGGGPESTYLSCGWADSC